MPALRFLMLSIFTFTVLISCIAENEKNTAKVVMPNVIQVNGDGFVDWSQNEISARGVALPSNNITDPVAAKALIREAALTIATRNLVKIINGVKISSEQTVEKMALADDKIKTRVDGLVRGATIRQEKYQEDGSYEVVMIIKMYGKSGLAECIDFNKKVSSTVMEYAPKVNKTIAIDIPIDPTVKWTGVVIDCRGKKLQPVMEPCVMDSTENLIYPNQQVPKDFNMTNGLVSYYVSLDAAIANKRVGAEPLLIKATDVKGSSHPIISSEDAQKLLTADYNCKVLSTFAVCFLLD